MTFIIHHRFYANENFPRPAVDALKGLGHDVLTTHEAGASNVGLSDNSVLAFASIQDRAVLTFNRRDFVRLHQACSGNHAGIVVCSEDHNYAALAARINEHTQNHESLRNQLIRIHRPSSPPVPADSE